MARSIPIPDFPLIARQLETLIAAESDLIANLANVSALLYQELPDVNWVGFYRRRGNELLLGPFQGKPACVRIPWGEGVCGSAAARAATLRVDDVHEFPGHIACDAASTSEIVVPLIVNGTVLGVLDIDSPVPARFSDTDQHGIESLMRVMLQHLAATLARA